MPQFQFHGFNQEGVSQSGSVHATNANDAVRQLTSRGLIVQTITEELSRAGSFAPPIQSAPPAQTMSPVGSQSRNAKATTHVPPKKTYTGLFKDHDLFLLTAQMSSILRSGISSHEMCQHLAQRQTLRQVARDALTEMARLTASGRPLSSAMSAYPDIFPPGVVGATKAGEEGGYLPQALEHASLHIQESAKLRKQGGFVLAACWAVLLCLPVLGIFLPAFDHMMARLFRDGATNDGLGSLGSGLLGGLLSFGGISLVLMLCIWIFGPRLFGRTNLLPIRHRLAARFAPVRQFSQFETSQTLAFHLEKTSAAGLSPFSAWKLAASAVPNIEFQRRLLTVGQPSEKVRISDLLHQSNVLPYEMIQLVETGEYTGTVPNAMEQVRAMSEAESKRTLGMIKVRFWLWIGLISIGGNCVIMTLFYRGFYDSIFRHVLEQ